MPRNIYFVIKPPDVGLLYELEAARDEGRSAGGRAGGGSVEAFDNFDTAIDNADFYGVENALNAYDRWLESLELEDEPPAARWQRRPQHINEVAEALGFNHVSDEWSGEREDE